MSAIVIRPATRSDHTSIRAVEMAAFGGPLEAGLVEALRASGDVVLEFVALRADVVVGHVLFTRLVVRGLAQDFPAVALAPLAVTTEAQGQGIGSRLVEAAHRSLEGQEQLSIVLGDPAYYGRFGYSHARAAGFESDYQGEALQALAWGEAPTSGHLVYPVPFREL